MNKVLLNRVFVYGTLKPGLRYHDVALQGGKFEAEEAYIEGFNLYHLSPENYPAVTKGDHRVHGWCFTYDNIEMAMPFLDELEGVYEEPPLYRRIQTKIYLKNRNSASNSQDSCENVYTWAYVYTDEARCQPGDSSAKLLPNGIWEPAI